MEAAQFVGGRQGIVAEKPAPGAANGQQRLTVTVAPGGDDCLKLAADRTR
jgi:hypothetical protein